MVTYSLLILPPGAGAWQELPLPEPQPGRTLSIGSGPANQLVLYDPLVHETHARLLLDPKGVFLCDPESSGVLLNGQPIPANQWVPLAPGARVSLGGTLLQVNILEPAAAPRAPAPKRRTRLWLSLLLAGSILLVLCAAAGVYLWFNGDALVSRLRNPALAPTASAPVTEATAGPGPAPTPAPARALQTLTLSADGQAQTDANGVGAALPPGALKEGSAQLSAAELQGELAAELGQAYEVLSPTYTLAAQGAADGLKPAEIRFPAPQDDLRVMAVIDGVYAAVLFWPPNNGALAIPANIGPSDPGALAGRSPMWSSGTIQYLLVRPKEKTRLPSPAKLASQTRQETPYPCFSLTRTRCWQNSNGSIQLMLNKDISLTPQQAYVVINGIQAELDRYGELGLDGADYSGRDPVQVVITAGSGVPQYRVANGVIYLPNDVASRIAAGGTDIFLVHELAHLIQDQSYCLTCSFYDPEDTWWIETAAENLVMLVDPGYVAQNLTVYGQIDTDAKTSVLQSAPYQWPVAEFYAHAQQVKVNMCPDAAVCPLTQQAFIAAINNGEYPYAEGAARQKLHANLPDYARYLLGKPPQKANTAISLDAVQTGENYGDFIRITQTKRDRLSFAERSGGGRITDETQGGMSGVKVEANLQKDGVYVLRVEVGHGGKYGSLPASLKIEPGPPLYYRLNNGEVQYHDGKSALILRPLVLGTTGQEITSVRLVAVGQQGGEVFKAQLGLVDLSGMWFINLPDKNAWTVNVTCSGNDDSQIVAGLATMSQGLAMMTGDFQPDAVASGLTWAQMPSRAQVLVTPGLVSAEGLASVHLTGMAVINEDEILFSTKTVISERPPASYANPSADSVVAVQLPGTISATASFSRMEYAGTDAKMTAGLPNILAWKLSGGRLIFVLDNVYLNQDLTKTGVLEKETRNPCKGTVEMDAEVFIYQEKK